MADPINVAEAAGNAATAGETLHTQCCIAGGGPAGMMLGFLLARAGVEVVVLEKHADFFRDFRGDTVHPSTLELMHELGLLDAFLQVKHNKIETLSALIGASRIQLVDFRHLQTRCKFIALMPQWDFLNFLAEQARRYPTFDLRMKTQAVDLVRESDRVVGVAAETEQGPLTIRADLVVACDGRQFDFARERGIAGACVRRADGRAVVSPVAPAGGRAGDLRPCRGGTHDDHAGPWRLLAMRLCHRQGRLRPHPCGGPAGLSHSRQ